MSPNRPKAQSETRAGTPGQFVATSWTAVVAAQQGDTTAAREALAQLCQVYWQPLYAYLLRLGHSQEDAKDLTQQFFFVLLSKNYLGAADRTKGKFRTFLLTALSHFLANEWDRANAKKRGGGQEHVSLDLETEEGWPEVEPATTLSPLKLFEQRWARTLFRQAQGRLEQEYAAAGKSPLFQALKEFLEDTAEGGDYGAVAVRLKMSTGAVRVAVHRLRQRYGEWIRDEVERTLVNPSPEEVEQELRHLMEGFSAD